MSLRKLKQKADLRKQKIEDMRRKEMVDFLRKQKIKRLAEYNKDKKQWNGNRGR